MTYLTNAFSINMLAVPSWLWGATVNVTFTRISPMTAAAELKDGFTGAIGHADTAAIVAGQLGLDPAAVFARHTVTLTDGDQVIVAQYRGPRLPEGAVTLPDGAAIDYYRVVVV